MWEYENCMHLSDTGRLLRVGESAALEMTYCHGSYSSPQSPMKPSLLLDMRGHPLLENTFANLLQLSKS